MRGRQYPRIRGSTYVGSAVVHTSPISHREKELEQGTEIPHHETRVGKDGVAQPAEKPKPPPAPTSPTEAPPPPPEAQGDAAQAAETDDPSQPGAQAEPQSPATTTAPPPIKAEPPQPGAPAEYSEPAQEEARDPGIASNETTATAADTEASLSPEPIATGVKVTAEMMNGLRHSGHGHGPARSWRCHSSK
jgi:hypothetical protein